MDLPTKVVLSYLVIHCLWIEVYARGIVKELAKDARNKGKAIQLRRQSAKAAEVVALVGGISRLVSVCGIAYIIIHNIWS